MDKAEFKLGGVYSPTAVNLMPSYPEPEGMSIFARKLAPSFQHLGLWEESNAPADSNTARPEITFDPSSCQLV